MTTLALRVPVRSGARGAGLTLGGRAFAYAAVVVVTLTSLPNGPSLALARWSGARIVSGSVWPGIGWLGALSSWALAFGGTAALLAAAAAASVVAVACTEQRARSHASRPFALGAVFVTALCGLDAFRAGGGASSMAFAAALALALSRTGPGRTVVAAALTVVWCNVSADGVLAPLIALTFAAGVASRETGLAARRSAWVAALACALATLATPAFATFPLQAFAALRLDGVLDGIVAQHPAAVAPVAYRAGFTLVVLGFLIFGAGARLRAGDALLVILATLLALANGMYLGLFGVLVAPVLAGAAYESFGRRETARAAAGPGDGLVVAFAFAFAAALATLCAPRADAALARQPYALVATLSGGPPLRWYCADVDWCSYALATGARGTSALLDGRIALSSSKDVEAQRAIAHVSSGWRATLEREHIDALLVRRDRALATLLRVRGDWRPVAHDATAELFVRAVRR